MGEWDEGVRHGLAFESAATLDDVLVTSVYGLHRHSGAEVFGWRFGLVHFNSRT